MVGSGPLGDEGRVVVGEAAARVGVGVLDQHEIARRGLSDMLRALPFVDFMGAVDTVTDALSYFEQSASFPDGADCLI